MNSGDRAGNTVDDNYMCSFMRGRLGERVGMELRDTILICLFNFNIY